MSTRYVQQIEEIADLTRREGYAKAKLDVLNILQEAEHIPIEYRLSLLKEIGKITL